MKWILDKSSFLNGITNNPETGWQDLYGVDPYRELGYIAGGWKSINATSGTITNTISWTVLDNCENHPTNSVAWLVGNNVVSKYDIDIGTLRSTTTTTYYGYGGAEQLKNFLYVAGSFGRNLIGKLNITSGNLGAWTASLFNLKQCDYYEMVRMQDRIYGCNKDSIFKISDSVTFDGSALVLETNTTAVSVAPYGEYLAIGSIKGNYAPGSAAGTGQGLYCSKLYFWDTTANSWDKERSTTINGRILKVLNKKGTLYVFVKDRPDSISLNYFDGSAIQPLKRITLNEGVNVREPQKDAYDIKGDEIFFGLTDTGSENTGSEKLTARVMSYGKGYAELNNALFNPFVHPSVSPYSVYSVDSIKWIKDDSLMMSITDTGSHHTLKTFKPSNGYYYYNVKTPNLYTGVQQTISKIRLNFKPLSTNDVIYVKRNIDNAGFETSIWDSCSYAQHGAISTYPITKTFDFNTLQLRIDANVTAGNVRLRNIIIDTVDTDVN